jgi:hypothetical protein
MITIEFEITRDGYTLKDAIVLSDNHGITDVEIEAIKQRRFDDFLAIVTAPQVDEVVINGE